jgi:TPR repeat protein
MNDPVAMFAMGKIRHHEGDYETAFDYLTKAAGLGVGGAHHALSGMYFKGQGVEKDMTMSIYHAEEAAMLGDPTSRYSLGFYDVRTFKYDRAKKHLQQKKIMPLPFVHIRMLWMQRKAPRGN